MHRQWRREVLRRLRTPPKAHRDTIHPLATCLNPVRLRMPIHQTYNSNSSSISNKNRINNSNNSINRFTRWLTHPSARSWCRIQQLLNYCNKIQRFCRRIRNWRSCCSKIFKFRSAASFSRTSGGRNLKSRG